MRRKLAASSAEELQRSGFLLGNQIRKSKQASVLCLEGMMGLGKSEFARGFIRSLTRKKNLVVPSPTFVLMNTYPLSGGQQNVHHVDLHRVVQKRELDLLNLEELYEKGDHLVVEWPEMMLERWKTPVIRCELSIKGLDDKRLLQFEYGEMYEQPMERYFSAVRSAT